MICPRCNIEYSDSVLPLHMQRCVVNSTEDKQEDPEDTDSEAAIGITDPEVVNSTEDKQQTKKKQSK